MRLAIGLAGALLLRSSFRPARALTRAYVEVFRGTPALVQLFIIYFGLPSFGLLISPFWAGVHPHRQRESQESVNGCVP